MIFVFLGITSTVFFLFLYPDRYKKSNLLPILKSTHCSCIFSKSNKTLAPTLTTLVQKKNKKKKTLSPVTLIAKIVLEGIF